MSFRNGERVICVGTTYEKLIGKSGTVVGTTLSLSSDLHEVTRVDWDDEIEGGWDCYGLARDGHGWNVATSELRPEFSAEFELLDRFAHGEIAIDVGSNEDANSLVNWVRDHIPDSDPYPKWWHDNDYEEYPLVFVQSTGVRWSGPLCNGVGNEHDLPDSIQEIISYSRIVSCFLSQYDREDDITITNLNLEEVL